MDPNEIELKKQIQERFAKLPKVVQDAITSADVEKHLRELANTHKLHLDQWEDLENQVMMTLLGFEPAEELQENIRDEVKVPDEIARVLAEDISRIVFEPVRQELERQLEHPEAKAAQVSGVEAARTAVLAESDSGIPAPASSAEPVNANAPTTPGPADSSQLAAGSSMPPAASPPPIIIPPVTPAAPATPPPAPPTEKVARAPISESYHAGQPSSERASVHDDPYREPPA